MMQLPPWSVGRQQSCKKPDFPEHHSLKKSGWPHEALPAIPAEGLAMWIEEAICKSNPVGPSSHDSSPTHKCMKNLRKLTTWVKSTLRTMKDINCCKPLCFGTVCYTAIENWNTSFSQPLSLCTGMLKDPIAQYFSFAVANADVLFMWVLMEAAPASHMLCKMLAVYLFIRSLLFTFSFNPRMALICFLGLAALWNMCLDCVL